MSRILRQELRPTWRESLTSWSFSSSDVSLKGDDKDKIKDLDNFTETQYSSDKTWKWINIIRMLVTKLDKDPKALILLPGEKEVTSQAYLKAVIL